MADYALIKGNRIANVIVLDESVPHDEHFLWHVLYAYDEVASTSDLGSAVDGMTPGFGWVREAPGLLFAPAPADG